MIGICSLDFPAFQLNWDEKPVSVVHIQEEYLWVDRVEILLPLTSLIGENVVDNFGNSV